MSIIDLIITAFLWIIVLAFSSIPGVVFGSFIKPIFGPIGYWIGFIVGAAAFIFYMSPILFVKNK
jgi:hypothetical protein